MIKVETLDPFPPNSNPFHHDRFHQGVTIGSNVDVECLCRCHTLVHHPENRMSISASARIIVGVSYVDKMDELLDDDDFDDQVSELDLRTYVNSQRFDSPDDLYVGVIFDERPTDAQVAEATAKVSAALPKLRELYGEPSSDIETWLGVDVG